MDFISHDRLHVSELLKHDAVKPLIEFISIRNDLRLIEAAARTLKAIYKCPTAELFQVKMVLNFYINIWNIHNIRNIRNILNILNIYDIYLVYLI
ncbi:hypothetical protein Glove_330g36 [Diversispora epigaea]|uniref:Uncharacterized protein n=1 Tax=Diversispora epigaea TaxID=1348612 RepID=A0A397HJS1_9GLOM|nr:hypothetical protein Glove_330g36 [Diversispora epigaea]